MIQSLRSIKARIRSIASTRKITNAMQLVSASKLNRARNILIPAHAYYAKLESMVSDFLKEANPASHPFFEKRVPRRRVAVCPVTSDAGLCGVYNHAVITLAEDFIKRYGQDKITIIAVGKEGYNYFRKHNYSITHAYTEFHSCYSRKASENIKNDAVCLFMQHAVDEVYVAYTRFDSTLRHKPIVEKLLPLEVPGVIDGRKYIMEPDSAAVLEALIASFIDERVNIMLLNAFTSEHSARMIAMKTATDNADELIDILTLQRNKARQAAITKEVIEIASAAEALRA